MKKILYRVVVKPDQIKLFEELVDEVMIPEAKKIRGCRSVVLYQNRVKQQEYLFYELWDHQQDISLYKQNLIDVMGPARAGEEFPAKFNDLLDEDEDLI